MNLNETWRKYLEELKNFDFSTFELKKQLKQSIWKEDRLRSNITKKLLKISNDFWEGLGLKDVEIVDIIVTGSIANYNWTNMSDVDLHILVHFGDVDENVELVGDFFRAKSGNWNRTHDITIKGHEVEIYVQDAEEPHTSTGVYSVLRDEWNKKPSYKEIIIDENLISQKAQCLMDMIDEVEKMYQEGSYEQSYEESKRIRDKIRRFRKCGLETGGEYSPENLAFKVLRRNGYLGKLSDFRVDSYDNMMSMNSSTDEKIRLTIR